MFDFPLKRRPQEVFNWLLSIDNRDYDVWDKGKVSWQIQYRRTNGSPKYQIKSKQSEAFNYSHDDMDDVAKETSMTEESLDHQEDDMRTTKPGRQKREDLNNNNGKPEDIRKLSQPTHSIIFDEDVSVDNYEMFPEREIDRYRLRAKLTIMKDDVQSVLPITKVIYALFRKIYLNKIWSNSYISYAFICILIVIAI